jgi:hypothetical protein
MDSNSQISICEKFLTLYFYCLEQLLRTDSDGLSQIKFQSEEANTDEFFKKYMKDFIKEHNKIDCSKKKYLKFVIDGKEELLECKTFTNFKISEVYLPEDLSLQQKAVIAKGKRSVYTNPDLYLKITNEHEVFYEPIELKSTKGSNIPGSSVQQVSPYEWVIFLKGRGKNIEVSIGHYINCITNRLPFPDRSPRPQIGYDVLKKWNNQNRLSSSTELKVIIDTNEREIKSKILSDWQDYLASEWLKIVVESKVVHKTEKWFNNALRKYSVKLIDHTDNLSEGEKDALIERLNSQIK